MVYQQDYSFSLQLVRFFFTSLDLTLQKTILDGLIAVLAVTMVDYFYITLAIFGIGKLFENKQVKKIFGIFSSIVLIIFGVIIIKDIIGSDISTDIATTPSNLLSSFLSVFFLTISSPLTIVFFTSLFASKALEYNYSRRELYIFGLSTGSATFLFLGSSVIVFSLLGAAIPTIIIKFLNILVGILLIGYGAVRLTKVVKNNVLVAT